MFTVDISDRLKDIKWEVPISKDSWEDIRSCQVCGVSADGHVSACKEVAWAEAHLGIGMI